YSFGPVKKLKCRSTFAPGASTSAGYSSDASNPRGARTTVRGFASISSWVGGGRLIGRTISDDASLVGIDASAKNRFCAETQTRLVAGARYSFFGVRGKTNNTLVFVAK